MSGDIELDELLGPEPVGAQPPPPNLPAEMTPSQAQLYRSRSYPVNRAAKKLTPQNLLNLLNYIAEVPITSNAAARAGINVTTLKLWLQRSSEGAAGDKFDVKLPEDDEDDEPVRFHEAWEAAMAIGVERLEYVAHQRASGYLEPLSYQGRVQYKYDPAKCAVSRELGLPEFVPENYLLDELGAPVPETILKMDPDLLMFLLKARKPNVYGAKASVDVNVRGGVLVVSQQIAKPEDLNTMEQNYRMNRKPSVAFEEGDDE